MRHDIVHDSRYLKFNVIFLIIALLTTFMFIDTFLIKFYDIVKKNFITLDEKKILFGIVTSACLILELVIFQYMKKLIKKTKVNIKLNPTPPRNPIPIKAIICRSGSPSSSINTKRLSKLMSIMSNALNTSLDIIKSRAPAIE